MLVSAAPARAELLKPGDPAPALFIKHWLKGEPVDLAQRPAGSVTVIEFWATWCPPCLMSIPHLSEMQDQFKSKGVTFVGVTTESQSTVEKFLKNGFDSKMRYAVAIDDGEKTNNAWMAAAAQNGIPCAFIVKDGKIAWIGHPMDSLDSRVAELCGDTEFAERKEKLKSLADKIADASDDEKWPEVLASIDAFLKIQPTSIQHQLAKYHVLQVRLKQYETAASYGRAFVASSEDADALNALAWSILDIDDFEGARDVELATLAAKKSVDLSKEEMPRPLDTYAAALAAAGNYAEAVNWQKKAVDKCSEGDRRIRRDLMKKLDEYQRKLSEKNK